MGSGLETERRKVILSGIPLREHPINNINTKDAYAGQKRIELPKKALRAKIKKQRLLGKMTGERIHSITERVLHCLNNGCCDKTDLATEIRYLRKYGISFRTIDQLSGEILEEQKL